MNIERLTILAEWLEGGAKHERITFDMSCGFGLPAGKPLDGGVTDGELAAMANTCGTVCCIAGAAFQFFAPPDAVAASVQDLLCERYENEAIERGFDAVVVDATDLLGLDYTTAAGLFSPCPGDELHLYTDPAWAARVIRRLIATGKVDWEAERPSSIDELPI